MHGGLKVEHLLCVVVLGHCRIHLPFEKDTGYSDILRNVFTGMHSQKKPLACTNKITFLDRVLITANPEIGFCYCIIQTVYKSLFRKNVLLS